MTQRTALEQDMIDFARNIEEIFSSQMELQKEIRELLALIFQKSSHQPDAVENLCLVEFGVNKAPPLITSQKPTHLEGALRNGPSIF